MAELQNTKLDQVPAPVADIKTEAIAGELLLYHPQETTAIYLSPSAAVIWSLCDGQRKVREIIRLIEEAYPEAATDLTEDVFATLRELEEKKVMITR